MFAFKFHAHTSLYTCPSQRMPFVGPHVRHLFRGYTVGSALRGGPRCARLWRSGFLSFLIKALNWSLRKGTAENSTVTTWWSELIVPWYGLQLLRAPDTCRAERGPHKGANYITALRAFSWTSRLQSVPLLLYSMQGYSREPAQLAQSFEAAQSLRALTSVSRTASRFQEPEGHSTRGHWSPVQERGVFTPLSHFSMSSSPTSTPQPSATPRGPHCLDLLFMWRITLTFMDRVTHFSWERW